MKTTHLTTRDREARDFWRWLCRTGRVPADIPHNPQVVYADEWVSWTDWVGWYTENKLN